MAKNRILVIDDDENISKVIRLYLEKEGMDVLVASDGKTGLDFFTKENPDLVLLDIMMPEMDGIEVIKNIRKDSGVPSLCSRQRAILSTRCWRWNLEPTTTS